MKLTLTGIPPYSGEYPLDIARFTNRDLHDLKRISGHMPMQLEAALEQADTDVVVALAYIALRKTGRFDRIDENAIWDAELGSITLDLTDEDQEAGAVPPPNATGTPSPHSGSPSPTVSELHPENPLPATGTHSSDQPAYAQRISGT